jgi:hypothetical protein
VGDSGAEAPATGLTHAVLAARERVDPEVEAARQEAQAALPDAWALRGTDREGFQWFDEPYVIVRAWAALAEGPGNERMVAIAADEATAYRQLARRLRGDLDEREGWAPPSAAIETE